MYKVFGIVIVKVRAGSLKVCISKTDWYKGEIRTRAGLSGGGGAEVDVAGNHSVIEVFRCSVTLPEPARIIHPAILPVLLVLPSVLSTASSPTGSGSRGNRFTRELHSRRNSHKSQLLDITTKVERILSFKIFLLIECSVY